MNNKIKETVKLLNDEYFNALTKKSVFENKAKKLMKALNKTELLDNALKVEGLNRYLDFLKETMSSYGEYIIQSSLSIGDTESEIYIYYNLYNYSVKEISLLKSLSENSIQELVEKWKKPKTPSKTHENAV